MVKHMTYAWKQTQKRLNISEPEDGARTGGGGGGGMGGGGGLTDFELLVVY